MAFDFDAAVQAPHRMQPGLRRLAPGAAQLTPLATGPGGPVRHLGEKLAVLATWPQQALLSAPGFDATPALQALADHAATAHPQALRIDGDRWHAPALGWSVDARGDVRADGPGLAEPGPLLAALAPGWRRTALLSVAFADDFAIVDGATGTLPWLAVALPSMWAPEEKVGQSFAAAHAPVADNRLIVGAAAQLVTLVTAGERWERFVWTLTGHPRLHAHPDRVDPQRWPHPQDGLDDDSLAAVTWFRSERQTFIPVPNRPQAVFTIGVDVQPMAQVAAAPQRAARLHDALASMSDAVLAYRGLAAVQPALLRWLARRATASATPA